MIARSSAVRLKQESRRVLCCSFIILIFLASVPIIGIPTRTMGNQDGHSNLASASLASLQVSVRIFPGVASTPLNLAVVAASVSSSGNPIPGASVTFKDSLGSSFQGATQTTNSSGVALTTVQFTSGNTGLDTITASATATNYGNGNGSATLNILPYGNTQLTITEAIVNRIASGGSSDVIQGGVYWLTCCGYSYHPVPGATVTIGDIVGSTFPAETIRTDSNGRFSINFEVGMTANVEYDPVSVSASDIGYSGSTSTTLLQVNPSSSNYLTVLVDALYPSLPVTSLNYEVLKATVTSDSMPLADATVTFADGFGSSFIPSIVATNSSGVALTTVQFTSGNTGLDTITASATATNFNDGVASSTLNILPYGNTQLTITEAIVNRIASGGSSDVIQGGVYWLTCCGYSYHPVPGATVTIGDIINSSFSKVSIKTNANGFYSANFTLGNVGTGVIDPVTVTASALNYAGSGSTVLIMATPESLAGLTVKLNSFYPSTTSTALNQMVLMAHVTAGGVPIAGASVSFGDSWGSTFLGSVEPTDSNGTATTIVVFTTGNTGIDTITASASSKGYNSGLGSNTVEILPYGSTQLTITERTTVTNGASGTHGTISGNVYWLTCCGYSYHPVPGATVTVSDTLGSNFGVSTITTGASGNYAVNFTLPSLGKLTGDVVTASASDIGFTGSGSSVYVQVGPTNASSTSETSTATVTRTVTNTVRVTTSITTVVSGTGTTVTTTQTLSSLTGGTTSVTNSVTQTVTSTQITTTTLSEATPFSTTSVGTVSNSTSSGVTIANPFGDLSSMLLPLTLFIAVFVAAVFVLRKRL